MANERAKRERNFGGNEEFRIVKWEEIGEEEERGCCKRENACKVMGIEMRSEVLLRVFKMFREAL